MIAQLKGYKTEEFHFVSKLPGNTKINLSNKYSYNVGYSNQNTAKGEFRAEIFDKDNPEKFRVDIVISAIFATDKGADKAKLHVETYNMLFPYVKSSVAMLTGAMGIPPVNIPFADISKQNIYRLEMPQKNDSFEQ